MGLEGSAHPTCLSRFSLSTLPYLVELLADPLPVRSLPENPPAALALIEMIQPIKGPRWHLSSNVFFRHVHKHPAAGHAPRLEDVELQLVQDESQLFLDLQASGEQDGRHLAVANDAN